MITRSLGALVLACLMVAACSLSVPPKQYAGVPGQPYVCLRYAIPVGLEAPPNSLVGDPFVDRVLAAANTAKSAAAREPVSESMLFLSGGSQHGAFGAGFLNRWSEMRGGLPRFRVVTGVSTGALQSNLAFTGETREIVNRYAVRTERELLTGNTTAHLDGSTAEALSAAGTIVHQGSLAELTGLRRQLLGLGPQDRAAILNDERLARIADEAADGRKLFVGAVELDTADAVAFDLTRIAQDYTVEADAARRETLRRCYAEALVASSSVPIAAQPSFIEGKMFIDGGARFGVLPAKLLEVSRLLAARRAPGAGPRPNLFVIVNGTLETSRTCDLKRCENTAPIEPFPPVGGTSRTHPKWSFPDLAFRSLSILINQSYVSSVELARRDAEWCRRELHQGLSADQCDATADPTAMRVHFVRILPGDLADGALSFGVNGLRAPTDTDTPFEAGMLPCDAWSKRDEEAEKPRPHEFHPRYMRCLIRYGAHTADTLRWATYEPRARAARR